MSKPRGRGAALSGSPVVRAYTARCSAVEFIDVLTSGVTLWSGPGRRVSTIVLERSP